MAKQFGQPCHLDQRVGKNHVTWNKPGKHMKKVLLSETEAGRVKNKNKNANTNAKRTCACENPSDMLLSFSDKANSAVKVANQQIQGPDNVTPRSFLLHSPLGTQHHDVMPEPCLLVPSHFERKP